MKKCSMVDIIEVAYELLDTIPSAFWMWLYNHHSRLVAFVVWSNITTVWGQVRIYQGDTGFLPGLDWSRVIQTFVEWNQLRNLKILT